MKDFNKEEYNKMCAEFLGFTEHIPNEERRKWNDECYPDLPYYRLEYNVPIQFGHDYITPTVLHALYNDADKIPRLTEKIAVAKMKFHSDWNWTMELVKWIEKTRYGRAVNGFHVAITDTWITIDNVCETDTPLSFKVSVNSGVPKKEAVVQAIWEFLNWYKENK